MKKTLTGSILALVGSIWSLAIILCAGNNLATEWDTELGRFWSTIASMRLTFLFVIAAVITVFGIIVILVELFRKEK